MKNYSYIKQCISCVQFDKTKMTFGCLFLQYQAVLCMFWLFPANRQPNFLMLLITLQMTKQASMNKGTNPSWCYEPPKPVNNDDLCQHTTWVLLTCYCFNQYICIHIFFTTMHSNSSKNRYTKLLCSYLSFEGLWTGITSIFLYLIL